MAVAALVVSILFYYIINKKYFILSILYGSLIYLGILILKLSISDFVSIYSVTRFFGYIVSGLCLNIAIYSLFSKVDKKIIRFLGLNFTYFLIVGSFLFPVLVLFYFFISSTWPTADTIVALLQTNSAESLEFIKNFCIEFLISIILLFIILIGYIRILKVIEFSKSKYTNYFLCISIILCCGLLYKSSNNLLTNVIFDTRDYINSYNAFLEAKNSRKLNTTCNYEIKRDNNKKGVYVMVIGESENRDHMQAYGYERETTPWLEKLKTNNNMYMFNKAYSCHGYTTVALAYALTAKNQYNNIEYEKAISILELANNIGIKTVWLSNQVRYSLADNPVTVIASEAQQQIWLNKSTKTCYTVNYDEELIDCFDDINIYDDMLIIVHLMGNHANYKERYPSSFSKFGNGWVNEYDNSVLYNDFIMKKLLDRCLQLPNFKGLIYFSDHGEAVKQGILHDVNRFEFDMVRIPMYIYLSDDYKNMNPKIDSQLRKAEDRWYTNDLVFDTTLKLMGVQSKILYQSKNDILSDEYDNDLRRFTTLYGKKYIRDDNRLDL